MPFDSKHVMSEAQSFASAAGDVISTNVINLGTGADNGDGAELFWEVWISTLMAGTAGSTLTITLQDCATEGGTYRTVLATRAFAIADVIASKDKPFLRVGLPGGVQGVRQFVRTLFTIGTQTCSAGAATSALTAKAA